MMKGNDVARREALGLMAATGAVAVAGSTAARAASQHVWPKGADKRGSVADWDWLVGSWDVQHRKLRERLVGSEDWFEFAGTCINWPVLDGRGNVDDNVFYTPDETYRGLGVRAFDPETGLWAIWWLDSRAPSIFDVPVKGGFENGVGIFLAEDSWKGTPVTVRFRWSGITENSAVWDQAFSTDGGKTWESNWVMHFTRRRN